MHSLHFLIIRRYSPNSRPIRRVNQPVLRNFRISASLSSNSLSHLFSRFGSAINIAFFSIRGDEFSSDYTRCILTYCVFEIYFIICKTQRSVRSHFSLNFDEPFRPTTKTLFRTFFKFQQYDRASDFPEPQGPLHEHSDQQEFCFFTHVFELPYYTGEQSCEVIIFFTSPDCRSSFLHWNVSVRRGHVYKWLERRYTVSN